MARASRTWSRAGRFAMTRYAAVWSVTRVSRLHYALATGDLTSKLGAAQYALTTFPKQWHRVIEESIRIRSDGGQSLCIRLRWHAGATCSRTATWSSTTSTGYTPIGLEAQ